MSIPIPVYFLTYSKVSQKYFNKLESISKNSFGVYHLTGETLNKMQQVVEQIQNVVQSDYVVTFRSYVLCPSMARNTASSPASSTLPAAASFL